MNRNICKKIFLLLVLVTVLFVLNSCEKISLGKEENHDGHNHDLHKTKDYHKKEQHTEPEHEEHEEDGHEGHGTAENTKKDANQNKQYDEPEHEEHEEGHEGHDHATHAAKDMEKSVEELFADSCEHNIKTYTCDECRYEVGVVKLPKDMIEQGLIEISKVERMNFSSDSPLTGEIGFNERKTIHISPRVSGVVSRVMIDLGDSVKAGEILVELESAELAEAQAKYLETLAEKALSKKTLNRQKSLREKQITSEREYLESQQNYEAMQIRNNSARQKLLRLGVSDVAISKLAKKGQQVATGKLAVRAPFAGEIIQLHAVRGERIDTGAEIIMLGDTKSLWVWIDLYEDQLAVVNRASKAGKIPVNLSVKAYPREMFKGQLDFVGKVMDQKTRTVKARVTVDNYDGNLKPGMFTKVRLQLEESAMRIAVPESSILQDEDEKFVFVHHLDDYFVRRKVETNRQNNGFIEIVGGLELNQTIAVAGSFLLKSDVLRSKMGAGCSH